MADLMKHNLSFKKDSIREYFIQPLMTSEELITSFAKYRLGSLPRKKKKALKKELKKRYGYDFIAVKRRVSTVQSLEEIARRYNPETIKQGIKNKVSCNFNRWHNSYFWLYYGINFATYINQKQS